MGGLSWRQRAQQRGQELLPCSLGQVPGHLLRRTMLQSKAIFDAHLSSSFIEQASGQRSDTTPAMQPQALEGEAVSASSR